VPVLNLGANRSRFIKPWSHKRLYLQSVPCPQTLFRFVPVMNCRDLTCMAAIGLGRIAPMMAVLKRSQRISCCGTHYQYACKELPRWLGLLKMMVNLSIRPVLWRPAIGQQRVLGAHRMIGAARPFVSSDRSPPAPGRRSQRLVTEHWPSSTDHGSLAMDHRPPPTGYEWLVAKPFSTGLLSPS